MERLVPLTKILMTLAVSVWAILLRDWASLLALVVVELGVLFLAGLLFKQRKAVLALTSFAVFLGLIQFLGSGDVTSAIVSGLRMLAMTLVFIGLLATTKLQDLTAALVTQCKIPYEYAFMFTAALRFVPDFIAESHAVQEAQACRGLSLEGNFIKRIKSYASVIQPLLLYQILCICYSTIAVEILGTLRNNGIILRITWIRWPHTQLCCIRRIEKNRLYCD